MKTLTIKEVAPYLPYGLKFEREFDKLTKTCIGFKPCYSQNCLLDEHETAYNITDVKPILYPLSDLTKPIKHNGEKLVSIDVILKLHPNHKINKERLQVIEAYLKSNPNPLLLEYWIIEKLLEWKFDVFNLIEQGLAIDVNTLENNPYK